MKVEVISATPFPIDVISQAAGTCYGKYDVSEKRMRSCFKAGHLSVFEHASVTFRIEGISRACMAQLTRHRLASFCVESQRYNRYDFEGTDWFVTPAAFTEQKVMGNWMLESWFCTKMKEAAADYRAALANGIKPEDARYLLPEATKTNLVMTMNCRELFHFFDMRLSKSAQWEIRELANAMKEAVALRSQQWSDIIELYGGTE